MASTGPSTGGLRRGDSVIKLETIADLQMACGRKNCLSKDFVFSMLTERFAVVTVADHIGVSGVL